MQDRKTMTLGGVEAEVKFPTVGQYIAIEQMKSELTNGRYALMSYNLTPNGIKGLDLVDAISYGSHVCVDPFLKMFGKITPKKMMDLPINDDIKELIRWYKDEYAPFHNSIEQRTDRIDQKEAVTEEVTEEKPEGDE